MVFQQNTLKPTWRRNTPLEAAFILRKVTWVSLNAVAIMGRLDGSYLLLTFISIFCMGSSQNGFQTSGANRMKLISAWLVAVGRVERNAGWCVCPNHRGSGGEKQVEETEGLSHVNRNNSVRCWWPEYRFCWVIAGRSRGNRSHAFDRARIRFTFPAL